VQVIGSATTAQGAAGQPCIGYRGSLCRHTDTQRGLYQSAGAGVRHSGRMAGLAAAMSDDEGSPGTQGHSIGTAAPLQAAGNPMAGLAAALLDDEQDGAGPAAARRQQPRANAVLPDGRTVQQRDADRKDNCLTEPTSGLRYRCAATCL
jgi:hypothetical protein